MRRLFNRLGHRALGREALADRERKGQRLGGDTRVGILVPAVNSAQRHQLKELVVGLEEKAGDVSWTILAYTGTTRKAYTKSRAQRMKKLGEGHNVEPDFPQLAQLTCLWHDDCNIMGLPQVMPNGINAADVLLTLDKDMSNLPLKALMRRSQAPFKVGPMRPDDGTLDFMLTWPDGGDMLSFVQLAFHYLKTLDLK